MPFWCTVAIGYIPEKKVLGLSKFARIAHQLAHRLQIQEQLGLQIAHEVSRITETPHVAVVLSGEHSCMTMRGINTPGVMTSSIMSGLFQDSGEKRLEFLKLIDK
jgi:GTP cyclohydrolase I